MRNLLMLVDLLLFEIRLDQMRLPSDRQINYENIFGLVVLASLATAQSVGAKYGSREPATCPSMKDPVNGALFAEQVRRYVMCGAERETGSGLFLV